jgi:hypothetical protein
MATNDYYTWVDAGRPWDLALPIDELDSWARSVGITVLGTIGDESHLTSNNPQDHTPFSHSAWPDPLPGYIVTAIDIDNVNGLGYAIEDQARAGALPWLKYMNHSNRHLDSRDGWDVEYSSDYHVHLSIRTDWIYTSIGSFNPGGSGSGGFTMFCKYGDENDAVEALQLRLLELDPACLPVYGADRGYGDETASALSRLVCGGNAQTYGPTEELMLEQMLGAKRGGGGGTPGPPGPPGEPGKTPTKVAISGDVVAWE